MSIIFNNLPVETLRVTSKFGPRNTGIKGASTDHKGLDLGRDFKKAESPIFAVASGKVLNSYWNNTRGWVVIIDHGEFKTLYQHLKAQSPIAKGSKVVAGQHIGIMGASTKTIKNMAVHLHMELIVNGKQIDPLPYLKNIKEEQKMDKELTMQEAIDIVQEKAVLDENTIQYLLFYKYGEALIKKLAHAMK